MQTETRGILSPDVTLFLCHDGSGKVPLGSQILTEVVVFPELAGISAVLGEQLSLEGICVQASVLVLLGDQFSLRGIWV